MDDFVAGGEKMKKTYKYLHSNQHHVAGKMVIPFVKPPLVPGLLAARLRGSRAHGMSKVGRCFGKVLLKLVIKKEKIDHKFGSEVLFSTHRGPSQVTIRPCASACTRTLLCSTMYNHEHLLIRLFYFLFGRHLTVDREQQQHLDLLR